MKLQMRGNIRNNSDDILVHPDVTTYAMKNDACIKINKQCHFPSDKNRKRASMLKDLKLTAKKLHTVILWQLNLTVET